MLGRVTYGIMSHGKLIVFLEKVIVKVVVDAGHLHDQCMSSRGLAGGRVDRGYRSVLYCTPPRGVKTGWIRTRVGTTVLGHSQLIDLVQIKFWPCMVMQ